MRQLLIKLLKLETPSSDLAKLLSQPATQEDLLGAKAVEMPSPDKIMADAAKLYRYSQKDDYQLFAKEAWARILASLDVVLDDKASDEKVQFHRGSIKATLDLLRISHQARAVVEQLSKEKSEASASLPR